MVIFIIYIWLKSKLSITFDLDGLLRSKKNRILLFVAKLTRWCNRGDLAVREDRYRYAQRLKFVTFYGNI